MDLTKPPDKILAMSVVGVVVLLWILVWLLGPKAEPIQPDSGVKVPLADLLGKPAKEPEESVEEPVPETWGRDPFAVPYRAGEEEESETPSVKTARPEPPRKVEGPQHKLSTVLISGSSRLAVINDRVYQVGDQIGAEKISKITLDHVVLSSSSGERLLRVPGPRTKVTVQETGRK